MIKDPKTGMVKAENFKELDSEQMMRILAERVNSIEALLLGQAEQIKKILSCASETEHG
jgi:hypothetical protein